MRIGHDALKLLGRGLFVTELEDIHHENPTWLFAVFRMFNGKVQCSDGVHSPIQKSRRHLVVLLQNIQLQSFSPSSGKTGRKYPELSEHVPLFSEPVLIVISRVSFIIRRQETVTIHSRAEKPIRVRMASKPVACAGESLILSSEVADSVQPVSDAANVVITW